MSPTLRSQESQEAAEAGAGQAGCQAYLQPERPKIEKHYLARREHHTNTGVRQVGVYQLHQHGLYVARAFVDHPRIRAWQAHLLPGLGLQICRYDFHAEREHDYYLDLATVTVRGEVWELHDHYLDVLLRSGAGARLVDEDELHAAGRAGYVTPDLTRRVTAQASALLSDLKAHKFHLDAYLAARNMALKWQNLSWLSADQRPKCQV